MAVDVEAYKRAVSRFATGVAVVASAIGERRAGMTANALFSLSLSPPSIIVSMQKDAESTRLVREAKKAAISFLSADQRRVSELFAMHNMTDEKFAESSYHTGPAGQPIINGSISAMEVDVVQIISAADHELVFCNITSIEHCDDRLPLIYWGGVYASVSGDRALSMPDPR